MDGVLNIAKSMQISVLKAEWGGGGKGGRRCACDGGGVVQRVRGVKNALFRFFLYEYLHEGPVEVKFRLFRQQKD